MSSSIKTPNYNLSQFADADKPTWRGDYNADMSKIDTGIKGARVEAQAAATIASDAKTGVQALGTRVTDVESTANGALSLAQSNETDLASTEAELTQHKAQASSQIGSIKSQISTINSNITLLDTRINGKQDIVPDGYQVGSHARLIHLEDAHDRTFVPGGASVAVNFAETSGNGMDKWCTLGADGEPHLSVGTYLVTFNTYLFGLSTASRSYNVYFGYKEDGASMTYSRYASTRTYAVQLGSGNPEQWGSLTYVLEFDKPTELAAFIQLPGGGQENATGKIGQTALYITRLNDGTRATRS